MIGALIAKSKIRSAYKKLSEHRLDEFLAGMADDAVFIYPGKLPASGEKKGKKVIEEWFRKWLDQYPQARFTIKHICVQNIFDMVGNNHIAAEWDVTIKNKNGKEFLNSGVTTIHLKMGKAVLIREYMFDMDVVREGWEEG
jgi:ketosteroid isomerase-like protein